MFRRENAWKKAAIPLTGLIAGSQKAVRRLADDEQVVLKRVQGNLEITHAVAIGRWKIAGANVDLQ